jgi:biopolymer transport protein ExbD
MPIKKPEKQIGKSVHLKFYKKGAHGKTSMLADLNVTPMVDMLMMLVVFLLMSFSASGEILFITKDITLPKAYNSVALDRAPVIAVSGTSIALEGELVMRTGDVDERWYSDWKLPPVIERLERMRRLTQEANPDKPFKGDVIIQSDGQVQFSVIKMVMFSCAQAGYINVNFAVQKGGKLVAAPAPGA